MKLRKTALAALIISLILSSCANAPAPAGAALQESSAEETKAPEKIKEESETAALEETEAKAVPEESAEPETGATPEENTEEPETETKETIPEETVSAEPSVYADMDGIIFGFMSGVGAWETLLKVDAEGSFEGQFYDMNMGEADQGYGNGTLYECAFTGKFSAAEKKDDLTWTAKVEELVYEKEKDGSDHYIEDEVLHIMTGPYGLSAGDEIEILLPGTPYESLSEGFLSWMIWRIEEGQDLPEIAIYNTTGDFVFYPDHYAMGDAGEFDSDTESPSKDTGKASEGSAIYQLAKNAFRNQKMPDYNLMPYVPEDLFIPKKPYQSVTAANLQGRWVNRYEEGGAKIEEILTVNGDRARIECYRDGVPTYAWNDEGTFDIEDRSDRNLCPAFRIHSDAGESVCTIYIRKVGDDSFYDGGFLCSWKRETPEEPADQYLYDTVTLENLQGLWYSEYEDGAGLYMDLLNIEGDRGWIFETVGGRISSVWNGEGPVSVVMQHFSGAVWYPELLLSRESGPSAGGIAGIYITSVAEDRFYDAGLRRWFVKIRPDFGGELEFSGLNADLSDDGSGIIEGGSLYRIEPAGEPDENGGRRKWNITVILKDGTEETIEHSIDEDSGYLPDATGIISEADVNFDDLPDVLLYRGSLGPRGVQYYDCYLNRGDHLEFCEGFNEIPEPYIDAASRQIIGTIRDSAVSYFELFYIVRGNTAEQVSEVRYEYDERSKDYIPKN